MLSSIYCLPMLPFQINCLQHLYNFHILIGVPQGSIRITFDDRYKIHLVRIWQKTTTVNKIETLRIDFQNGNYIDVRS